MFSQQRVPQAHDVIKNVLKAKKGDDIALPARINLFNLSPSVFESRLLGLIKRKNPKKIIITDYVLLGEGDLSEEGLKKVFQFLDKTNVKSVVFDLSDMSEPAIKQFCGILYSPQLLQPASTYSVQLQVESDSFAYECNKQYLLTTLNQNTFFSPNKSIWRNFAFNDENAERQSLSPL